MAILEQDVHPQVNDLTEYSEVKITCPVCKISKQLKFPKSVINEAKQLTTISLPKGLVCDHHFQAFVDKNFSVRGYQKVDFEFETQKSNEPQDNLKLFKENEEELFENLIVEGNFIEYRPNQKIVRDSHPSQAKAEKNAGKRSLKDIYEEFWEFIDDRNPKFIEFIEKDNRRIQLKTQIN